MVKPVARAASARIAVDVIWMRCRIVSDYIPMKVVYISILRGYFSW
jgi:hypothetical protein